MHVTSPLKMVDCLGMEEPGIITLRNLGEACLSGKWSVRTTPTDSKKDTRWLTESIPNLLEGKAGILSPPLRRGPHVFSIPGFPSCFSVSTRSYRTVPLTRENHLLDVASCRSLVFRWLAPTPVHLGSTTGLRGLSKKEKRKKDMNLERFTLGI